MKALLLSVILLSATAAQAEYCNSEAIDAAVAVNRTQFPNRTVAEATSTFTKYAGYHLKQYAVNITDSASEKTAYAVNVFEYESEGTECVVDSVVLSK